MAMRETERSLRWFFLIAGGLSVVQSLAAMNELNKPALREAPATLLAPLWFGAIAHLVFGALFVNAGLGLKQALLTGARSIQQLILVTGIVLLLEVIWILIAFGVQTRTDSQMTNLVGGSFAVGLRIAVVAYLYASVRRLSREAQARAAPPSLK